MPNIKSAKKRVKVTETKTLQNKVFRSQMKTDIKKYQAAVAANDLAAAQELYKTAVRAVREAVAAGNGVEAYTKAQHACRLLDKAASKGIIHKNCAAHKKSEFTKALNAMQA